MENNIKTQINKELVPYRLYQRSKKLVNVLVQIIAVTHQIKGRKAFLPGSEVLEDQ